MSGDPETGGGGDFDSRRARAREAGLADGSSGETTQPCDQAQVCHGPCDVAVLRILNAGDESRVVAADGPARRVRSLTSRQRRLLGGADLLYECIGEPRNAPSASPAKAELTIDAIYDVMCMDHPAMSFRIIGGSFLGPEQVTELRPAIIYGPSLEGAGSWLSPFWDFTLQPIECEARADACGVPNEGGPGTSSLTGIVRVHPKQDCSLTLSIPPLRQIQRSESATVDVRGRSVRTSTRGRDGDSETTTRTTDLARGTATTGRSVSVSDGAGTFTNSTTSGLRGGEEVSDSSVRFRQGVAPGVSRRQLEDPSGALTGETALHIERGITLTVNGQAIAMTQTLNNLLALANAVRQFFDRVRNWVPEVGWSFTMDIAILEGSLTAGWGRRPLAVEGDGRIARVESYFRFTGQVNLIHFTARLAFGIDISVLGVPILVAQISGTIEVNTPVRIDLNSGQGDNLSTSIVPAFTVRLDGTVAAVGVGYSAAVAVTFDFTGAFRVGFRTDPVFTGMLRLQRGDLIITQRMGRGSRRVGDPINIFPEARLWQGQAPS